MYVYVYRQFRHFALLAESGFSRVPTNHNRTRGLPRPGERMLGVEIDRGNWNGMDGTCLKTWLAYN